MALKIKEGITLHPFGQTCKGYDSNETDQKTLEVLFDAFPAENFEEVEATEIKAPITDEEAKATLEADLKAVEEKPIETETAPEESVEATETNK